MKATARRADDSHPGLREVPPPSSRARDAGERTRGEGRTYWVLIGGLIAALLGVLGYAVITGKLQF